MKWASDGHKAILSPCGPFIAFKPCFYSSPSFSALFFFISTKASLMHFIPGALTLDGDSLEQREKQRPYRKHWKLEWKLKIATLLLVLSEVVGFDWVRGDVGNQKLHLKRRHILKTNSAHNIKWPKRMWMFCISFHHHPACSALTERLPVVLWPKCTV